MSTERCLLSAVALAAALAAAPARAQPADRAEALNEEGKQLFGEKRYLEAYKRFRAATELREDPRFVFNVCFTLNFLERYEEAIDACERVEELGPDESLAAKNQQVLEALRQKVPAPEEPPGDGEPVGEPGGEPPFGEGPGGPTEPPPEQDPFALETREPPGSYTWSVGGELTGIGNAGVGDADDYQNGGGIHAYGNFLLQPERGFGVQGYLNVGTLRPDELGDLRRLLLVDFGGAVFLQRSLTDSIQWTPLLGAHVSLQQPNPAIDNAAVALGLRAELSLAYLFGSRKEHAVTVTPALNVYSPAGGENGAFDPADYGLDEGGATVTLGVGYQYRFSTPFGTVPLFTLE